jgi:uncharacterized OsmC-like protein
MIQSLGSSAAERSSLQRFDAPIITALSFRPGVVMKLTLLGEDSIRLEPTEGPMNIEAVTAEQSYSPFHMLAGGLAYCTFSVLYSWASHAKFNADDLIIDVKWTFAEDPHRVGSFDVRFSWPSLSPNRLEAAKRVAEMCTIHATLHHPPSITIDGSTKKP